MTDTRKTMQQALAALQFVATGVKVIDPPQSVITDAIEALREALAQQGEKQPVKTKLPQIIELLGYCPECGATKAHFKQAAPASQPVDRVAVMQAIVDRDTGYKRAAAPAAQPTCKQDLPVETEQERYVRMCPDIECGRKKQCTRIVGVSCMSRADIGAHGIGADK